MENGARPVWANFVLLGFNYLLLYAGYFEQFFHFVVTLLISYCCLWLSARLTVQSKYGVLLRGSNRFLFLCKRWHSPCYLLECLPKRNKCMRSRGCYLACTLCWLLLAFLYCGAFFWQFNSLDLDSISLEWRSSGFSGRGTVSSSTGTLTATAQNWSARTSVNVSVNEIRKYGHRLIAQGPCAQQQVKNLDLLSQYFHYQQFPFWYFGCVFRYSESERYFITK